MKHTHHLTWGVKIPDGVITIETERERTMFAPDKGGLDMFEMADLKKVYG